jgi:3',5'-cyclic AMP phosphodiesterase CpdA
VPGQDQHAAQEFGISVNEVSPARAVVPKLLAVSDLHVSFAESREIVANLRPESAQDWLLVAGDVSEIVADLEWALRMLSDRLAVVVWVPGNHELWTHREDPVRLRGEARYRHLVELCRSLGVITPEDPYPVWDGAGGPVTIVPLFLLYDYTFLPPGAATTAAGLARVWCQARPGSRRPSVGLRHGTQAFGRSW